MPDLKQSTSATVRVGPVVDTAGAVVTSATLTIKLSKAGGALANRNDATAITHDADGYYLVTLNATDTGTVGRLDLAVTGSGFLPFAQSFAVLHANVYDWLYGSAAPNTATPLDAAGIRSAVGLASANLDTQLADLPTVAEFEGRTLPSADYFVVGDYTAPPTEAEILAALDANTYHGRAFDVIMQRLGSYIGGETTVTDNGDGTATVEFKQADGATKSYDVTFDTGDGARSAIS